MAPPESTLSDTRARAYLAVGAVALLYVLAAPLSVLISSAAVQPWYAGVAALSCVGAGLFWWRPHFGCLEVFVPLVATVWVIAFTLARPDVIGPWIPAVQVVAMAAIVVGAKVRRRSGSN